MRDFPGGPVVKTLPSNAGGVGSIPVRGAKIPQASGPKNQNMKQKQYCNKFNKDFKKMVHIKKNFLKKYQLALNKCMGLSLDSKFYSIGLYVHLYVSTIAIFSVV